MFPFVSSHMKDNVQMIHFHIKSRGVQGLAFIQIIFEKCTKHFYFKNGEVGTEKTIANFEAFISVEHSPHIYAFLRSFF